MILIGEKLNSSIPGVKQALASQDGDFVRKLAQAQEAAGADFLDVNAAMFLGEETKKLAWMIQTVREVSSLPFVIDTPDPQAAAKAADLCAGENFVLNSVTLEKSRLEPMLETALKHKAGLVALCMDDSGIPQGASLRVELALALTETLTRAGLKEDKIYLDPMIQPIGSGEGMGLEALEAIRSIRSKLPGVHIVCGLSNCSFGLPKRALLNRTFLVAAMTAGLDCAILDPLNRPLMASLAAARAILGQDEYCMDYLDAFREGLLD